MKVTIKNEDGETLSEQEYSSSELLLVGDLADPSQALSVDLYNEAQDVIQKLGEQINSIE